MADQDRPRRSALFMPGSKTRAIEKARSLPADVLLLDLEDAVAPGEKETARQQVAQAVRAGGFGGREVVMRVNGMDTTWGDADLAAVADAKPDAVLLPKVEDPATIEAAAARTGLPVWAMIETPAGVLAAYDIARVEATACLVMGTNDLAAELGATPRPGRAELSAALQQVVLAGRAAGVTVLDGVYNAYKDEDGLARECEDGRAMGFDGKTLIHPAQLATTNRIFAPSPEALTLAERQLAAFAEAEASGQGIAVVDGKIVENLHVASARTLLARKAAIDALEQEVHA